MPEETVNFQVCAERHKNIEHQFASVTERLEDMEQIVRGNGDPKRGLISITNENQKICERLDDFMWSMNKRLWGSVVASLVGSIGTLLGAIYYFSQFAGK